MSEKNNFMQRLRDVEKGLKEVRFTLTAARVIVTLALLVMVAINLGYL